MSELAQDRKNESDFKVLWNKVEYYWGSLVKSDIWRKKWVFLCELADRLDERANSKWNLSANKHVSESKERKSP